MRRTQTSIFITRPSSLGGIMPKYTDVVLGSEWLSTPVGGLLLAKSVEQDLINGNTFSLAVTLSTSKTPHEILAYNLIPDTPESSTKGLTPHKCPVCNGAGKLNRPSYVAGDQRSWVTNSPGPWPCKPCSGTGILWS